MAKKLVEWSDLAHIYNELWDIMRLSVNNDRVYERVKRLLGYIEDNITQPQKEELNEFKRMVYKRIKESTTEEEKAYFYNLYQDLKEMGK